MEYLSTEKILVVDLGTAHVEEEEMDEALVEQKIGGIGITKYLYEKYMDDDPVVIGPDCFPAPRIRHRLPPR